MQVFVYVIESSFRSDGNSVREILNINNTELVSFHLIDYKKKKGIRKQKLLKQQFNNALVIG
jgi:hypothetical protein